MHCASETISFNTFSLLMLLCVRVESGESFTMQNPSPCTVEAGARSWRILHRARWRQVQDPGESFTVHGGGKVGRLRDRSFEHTGRAQLSSGTPIPENTRVGLAKKKNDVAFHFLLTVL